MQWCLTPIPGFNGTITKTWTHTVTGANPLIVLTADIWQDVGGTGTISSASWNGAAFTKATSTRTTADDSELWYLVASTTGSKTISVTINGNTDAIKLGTASLSGVSTSSPFDAVKSSNGFSTTPSVTVTPKFSGEAFVASLAKWTTLDATTSLNALYKNYASSTLMAASYKIATTSGAVTETYTAAGASSDWVLAMAAFRPATTTTGTASSTSATTTLSYDNNGNLTAEGTSTFSWDYRNQMTQSGNGLATSTYAYDQDGNRVKLTEGSVTTFFPNTLYSVVTAATTTKNIFANGMLISTIESASSTSSGGGGGIATSTPAFVQSKKDSATGAVTLTNPVTTGNLIVVGVTIWNTAIPSNAITDSKGNTYTKVGEVINATTLDHGAIFYAKNVTGGSSFTVTSSVGGTIAAHEYSGITVSNSFDKVASSTGFSTVPNSTSITTGNDHDLDFGLAWSNTTGDAWSGAGGYTLRENETNNNTAERIATEDQVISTASTTAALFNLPNATDWVAMITSFKPATTSSGGGGGSTASTTVRYVANDNISGSSIVMDASSSVVEALDYYPYGGMRVDSKTNYGGVRNKYAGTVYDALSGLNYMQARYQNSSRGQFVSQDPVFLGDPKQQVLTDPQSLKSYSYANDNPINKADPLGNDAIDYARPVDSSGLLSNYSHSFAYIVPQPGEALPSINANGMCINTN